MKSLKEDLLLGPAIKTWLQMWLIHCHFAQSWTDVFAVRIPCFDYHVEMDVWRMDLSGSLWKVWEKPVQNGDSMWCWKTILMHRWMMYLSCILSILISPFSAETATQPLIWFNHHCNRRFFRNYQLFGGFVQKCIKIIKLVGKSI